MPDKLVEALCREEPLTDDAAQLARDAGLEVEDDNLPLPDNAQQQNDPTNVMKQWGMQLPIC